MIEWVIPAAAVALALRIGYELGYRRGTSQQRIVTDEWRHRFELSTMPKGQIKR